MAKPIVISILADARGAKRGTDEAQSALGRLGKTAGRVGLAVGAGVLAAGAAVGVQSVKLASDAEQSIGATEQIYGKYADSIVAKSEKAATAVGLSANSYRELSNGLGAMLKNAGTPMSALGKKTDELVTLGADLAATFGGDTKDAVAAISSLMRGEANPIERYGVAIKQSDVNARLASQGLNKLTGEKLREAEATARLELLYEQTNAAQGQFGRESSTLAGQQQRLGAQWEDMKVKLGTRLLPVLTAVFTWLNDKGPAAFSAVEAGIDKVSPLVSDVAGYVSTLGGAFKDAAGFIRDNAEVIGVLAAGYAAYKLVVLGTQAVEWAVYLWQSRSVLMGAAKIAVTNGMTAAQRGLNAALRANPIGLVVAALTLLVAGAVWAYKNVDWFRAGVQAAFKWVVDAASALWDGIKWAFGKIVAGVVGYAGLVKAYLGMWVSAFKWVVNGAKDLYNKVVSWVGKVPGALGNIKNAVVSKLRGAGSWLYDSGRNIVQGLINGVTSLAGKIGTFFLDRVPGWIKTPFKKALGIKSPSRVFMADGMHSADGYLLGWKKKTASLRAVMGDVAGTVTDAFTPAFATSDVSATFTARSSAAGSTAGNTYIDIDVKVPPTANLAEVGREIRAALDAYGRAGGRR